MSKLGFENKTLGIIIGIALVSGALSGLFTALIVSNNNDSGDKTGDNLTFTLKAYITGYVGEGGSIDGMTNPDINVKLGDSVTIILKAGQSIEHDLWIDEFAVHTELVSTAGGDSPSQSTITFTVDKTGEFFYYCAVPGHRANGMEGKFIVGLAIHPDPAKTVDKMNVMRDPTDTGTPVGSRTTPKHLNFTLVSEEVVSYLEYDPAHPENAVTFDFWTYNATVPGPLLRAMVGDTVTITLLNNATSTQNHSVDLHAVTGPGGGAKQNNGNGTIEGGASGILSAAPGDSSSLTFVPAHVGEFVYHCASPHIPAHISKGMFGSIVIEPVGGLNMTNTKELYLGQNEVYTKFPAGTPGHNVYNDVAEFHEDPNYVLFNGKYMGLTGADAINVTQGQNVRIFFAVGGPNLASSFHMIGEIWDHVWYETSGTPMDNAETVLVAPGSVVRTELVMEYVGTYLIVDHALSRVFSKGALAVINVVAP